MRTRRMAAAATSLLVLALILGACAGGDDMGSADGADTGQAVEAEAPAQEAGGGSGGSGSLGDSGEGFVGDEDALGVPEPNAAGAVGRGPSSIDIGPSVIKTATIEIEVAEGEFQDAVRDGIATAERYGGFVLTTRVEDEENGRGSITLRVPAARFGAALADLEGLGDVKSETVSGEDVSQEFIDLQARLRHLLAQEQVMLELMERAETIPDTIRVQGQLEGIQLGIERLRGRIRYLDDQTDLSTIEVRMHEVGAVAAKEGEFAKAWARAKEAFVAIIAGLITSLGVIVPLALLIALVVVTVALVKPRFSSKTSLP